MQSAISDIFDITVLAKHELYLATETWFDIYALCIASYIARKCKLFVISDLLCMYCRATYFQGLKVLRIVNNLLEHRRFVENSWGWARGK